MKNKRSKIPKTSHIQLMISTWNKDSYSLYDYQAKIQSYIKQTYYLDFECKILRNTTNNKTYFKPIKQMRTRQENNLQVAYLKINPSNPSAPFQIQPNTKFQQQSSQVLLTYIVINNQFAKDQIVGYPLNPGNIIKLGRIEYIVLEVKYDQQPQILRGMIHLEDVNGVCEAIQIEDINQQHNCKICCCNQQTSENPLISPCNCKGSCQTIHVDCLKTWINTKVKKEHNGTMTTSYNFTKFQCEICKYPFPKFVKINQNFLEMITVTKPNKPYIILESLKNKLDIGQQKHLHLISLEEGNSVKIGRGHNADIRVSDISVSRSHAQVFFQNNQFYLKDLNSKFGTLVRFDEDIQISSDVPINLQIGKALYQFKMHRQPVEMDTQ